MAKCYHDRVRQTCSVCNPEQVYKAYQRAAKDRQLAFELTLEEFKNLTQAPARCVFCGEGPQTGEVLGIDRRANQIGYVIWNCQSACGPCNMLRKDLGQFVFLALVQKIARYQERLRQQTVVSQEKVEPPEKVEAVKMIPGDGMSAAYRKGRNSWISTSM